MQLAHVLQIGRSSSLIIGNPPDDRNVIIQAVQAIACTMTEPVPIMAAKSSVASAPYRLI